MFCLGKTSCSLDCEAQHMGSTVCVVWFLGFVFLELQLQHASLLCWWKLRQETSPLKTIQNPTEENFHTYLEECIFTCLILIYTLRFLRS